MQLTVINMLQFIFMLLNFKLLFLVSLVTVNIQAMPWIEYELSSVENSADGIIKTDLKSKRIDKTTFAMSGTLEFTDDFSNNYEAEVNLYHSAKGNNQFVKTPYKVPKDDLCAIVDGIYRKSIIQQVEKSSDLPKTTEKESVCANYKKGLYTFHQYLLPKDVIPKFLQIGYYKAEIVISKKNSDEASRFSFYIKLY